MTETQANIKCDRVSIYQGKDTSLSQKPCHDHYINIEHKLRKEQVNYTDSIISVSIDRLLNRKGQSVDESSPTIS